MLPFSHFPLSSFFFFFLFLLLPPFFFFERRFTVQEQIEIFFPVFFSFVCVCAGGGPKAIFLKKGDLFPF